MGGEPKKRSAYLVVREDEPEHGEWFRNARQASLKATWLREAWKANVRVIHVTWEEPGPASVSSSGGPRGTSMPPRGVSTPPRDPSMPPRRRTLRP